MVIFVVAIPKTIPCERLPFESGLRGNPALGVDGASGADLNAQDLLQRRLGPSPEINGGLFSTGIRRALRAAVVRDADSAPKWITGT